MEVRLVQARTAVQEKETVSFLSARHFESASGAQYPSPTFIFIAGAWTIFSFDFSVFILFKYLLNLQSEIKLNNRKLKSLALSKSLG